MIKNLNSETQAKISSDYIIIGSGAAGITIALELSSHGKNVIILESGELKIINEIQELNHGKILVNGAVFNDNFDGTANKYSQSAFDFASQKSFSVDLEMTRELLKRRNRVFGGGTTFDVSSPHGKGWSGECKKLDSIDFEYRDWIPNSGWPYSKSNLEPYYRRAHKLLKLGPINSSAEDLWSSDKDYYKKYEFCKTKIRYILRQFSNQGNAKPNQWKDRVRFGIDFYEIVRQSYNISAYINATVINLNCDERGEAVRSVTALTREGKKIEISGKFFILAAGAIESTRLLLLSNNIKKNGLGNEYDLVGRFFNDYVICQIGTISANDPNRLGKLFSERPKYANTRASTGLRISEEVQKDEKILNCSAYIFVDLRGDSPIESLVRLYVALKNGSYKEIKIRDFFNIARAIPHLVKQIYRRFRGFDLAQSFDSKAVVLCQVQQAISHESRIFLSDNLDKYDKNEVIVDSKIGYLERKTAKTFALIIKQECERLGIGEFVAADFVNDESVEFCDSISTPMAGHPCGSTRMSESRYNGVVDPDCKVYGLTNLFISSSSVMPTSGCTDVTFTIVALALKLADHLNKIE